MEQITLTDEDGNQSELYVQEETTLNGKHYLLLTEKEEGDSDAYLFREEADPENPDDAEAVYVPVTDDTEFDAVLSLFRELLEDTDIL